MRACGHMHGPHAFALATVNSSEVFLKSHAESGVVWSAGAMRRLRKTCVPRASCTVASASVISVPSPLVDRHRPSARTVELFTAAQLSVAERRPSAPAARISAPRSAGGRFGPAIQLSDAVGRAPEKIRGLMVPRLLALVGAACATGSASTRSKLRASSW